MEEILQKLRIISQAVAQGKRERKHPLPDWNLWKYPIHQMRGSIAHAPTATRRTDGATLAGISYNPVLAANIAVHSKKASRQNTAIKKRAQFSFNKPGNHTPALPLPGKEGLEMPRRNLIQNAFLGIALAIRG